MKTMSWSNAFNFINGERLNEFREKNYPEIPKEYVDSVKRWYTAGVFYISVCMFLAGFILGNK